MKRHHFNIKLLNWYDIYKRDLPWRQGATPYQVWISEVIFQQTRINQGIDYYRRFLARFPDVITLAGASEEEVLKHWQGLGYYNRARNLHAAARYICCHLGGSFPKNKESWIKLPGIGAYTASAIASIAFNEPVASVDGNMYRVLSRFFDIDYPIDQHKGKFYFEQLSNELIDPLRPGDFNQAIMDLGSVICKPRNPICVKCPLESGCAALQFQKIPLRPVKSRKKVLSERFLYYICIESNSEIVLTHRSDKTIWKNLYEFPLIESPTRLNPIELDQEKEWSSFFSGEKIIVTSISSPVIHRLTHQKMEIVFIKVNMPAKKYFPENFQIIDKKNIFDFPVPKPIERYLSENIT